MNNKILKLESFIELIDKEDGVIIDTRSTRRKDFHLFIVIVIHYNKHYYKVFDINSIMFNDEFLEWEKMIRDNIQIKEKPIISIDIIINEVSKKFNIAIPLMLCKKQDRSVVVPRQIAQYYAKKLTKLSFATIGKEIGGKDHATIMNSYKIVNNLIDTNKEYKEEIHKLDKIFEQYA